MIGHDGGAPRVPRNNDSKPTLLARTRAWYNFLFDNEDGMPRLLIVALVAIFIAWSISDLYSGCVKKASGSPLGCESIRDADRRHMCRAVAVPSPTECEFIKDSDLRAVCRVLTAKQK